MQQQSNLAPASPSVAAAAAAGERSIGSKGGSYKAYQTSFSKSDMKVNEKYAQYLQRFGSSDSPTDLAPVRNQDTPVCIQNSSHLLLHTKQTSSSNGLLNVQQSGSSVVLAQEVATLQTVQAPPYSSSATNAIKILESSGLQRSLSFPAKSPKGLKTTNVTQMTASGSTSKMIRLPAASGQKAFLSASPLTKIFTSSASPTVQKQKLFNSQTVTLEEHQTAKFASNPDQKAQPVFKRIERQVVKPISQPKSSRNRLKQRLTDYLTPGGTPDCAPNSSKQNIEIKQQESVADK